MTAKNTKRKLASAVLIGVLIVSGWLVMQPRLNITSRDRVLAVLPSDLTEPKSRNISAEERYRKLCAMAGEVGGNESDAIAGEPLYGTNSSPTDSQVARVAAAANFLKAHGSTFSQLEELVVAGPIRVPPVSEELVTNQPLGSFLRALVQSARALSESGDYTRSTRMLMLCVRLADELAASGDMLTYLKGAGLELETAKAVRDAISKSAFPVQQSKMLIAVCRRHSEEEGDLSAVVRSDFQGKVANLSNPKVLLLMNLGDDPAWTADPAVRDITFGTYDEIETASVFGRLFEIATKNASRPLSEFDHSGEKSAQAEVDGLPLPPDQADPPGVRRSWNHIKYRIQMNMARNSLGRIFLAKGMEFLVGPGLVENFTKWRSCRNWTLLLLAASVFRGLHGGRSPVNASDLVPIIGQWPTDPRNGNPMPFSAALDSNYIRAASS